MDALWWFRRSDGDDDGRWVKTLRMAVTGGPTGGAGRPVF